MDLRQRFDDHTEQQDAAGRALQAGMWTAVPCTIISVDFGKQTCSVQPTQKVAIRKPDGSQEWQSMPVLPDAPIHFPGGGGVSMTFPVKAGDEALAIIASRPVDSWHQSGGEQQQGARRMHDLSDAFVMVGFRSNPKALPGVSSDAVQLRSDDGTSSISLKPNGDIDLNTPGAVTAAAAGGITYTGDLTVNGDIILNGISLANHKHTGVTTGASNTGGPTS
ncbi:translation initiation factor IF-2 [Kaistia algarum]|uniref:Gp138 family membrane-puncturing spike protein n=1 Tax=Kaistia algarum TaxID=2083279 RepID=UPI000CE9240A|nr:Gp138 family membrane-puncturing spike protein [Kaistia algarum]MCX5516241.1 Gp138 family membrane-puncturing spike protein [Kaistia algarum]PPE78312.1 translation initiation factor IF-2 [Kaistia algarum]